MPMSLAICSNQLCHLCLYIHVLTHISCLCVCVCVGGGGHTQVRTYARTSSQVKRRARCIQRRRDVTLMPRFMADGCRGDTSDCQCCSTSDLLEHQGASAPALVIA